MKQVTASLKIELANFSEMKSFAQFGSDLDPTTLRVLKHGEVLLRVLRQKQYHPYSLSHQVFELFMAKHGYLDDVSLEDIQRTLDKVYRYVTSNQKIALALIDKEKEIAPEVEEKLHLTIKEFFAIERQI